MHTEPHLLDKYPGSVERSRIPWLFEHADLLLKTFEVKRALEDDQYRAGEEFPAEIKRAVSEIYSRINQSCKRQIEEGGVVVHLSEATKRLEKLGLIVKDGIHFYNLREGHGFTVFGPNDELIDNFSRARIHHAYPFRTLVYRGTQALTSDSDQLTSVIDAIHLGIVLNEGHSLDQSIVERGWINGATRSQVRAAYEKLSRTPFEAESRWLGKLWHDYEAHERGGLRAEKRLKRLGIEKPSGLVSLTLTVQESGTERVKTRRPVFFNRRFTLDKEVDGQRVVLLGPQEVPEVLRISFDRGDVLNQIRRSKDFIVDMILGPDSRAQTDLRNHNLTPPAAS